MLRGGVRNFGSRLGVCAFLPGRAWREVEEVGQCTAPLERAHPGCGSRQISESRSWLSAAEAERLGLAELA